MAPAFSSTRQAAIFGFLLLATFLLPALLGKSLLPSREEGYASASWTDGGFPFMQQQIFQEQGDIDILFMGASLMGAGLDTPQMAETLGRELGRPAVVRTFSWRFSGFDPMYFVAKDLLERRKVRMIVFSTEGMGDRNSPHVQAPFWFRFSENAGDLAGVSLRSQVSFYSCAMLGAPRTLLSMVRPNGPVFHVEDIISAHATRMRNPADRMGSFANPERRDFKPFTEFVPPATGLASSVLAYSEATRAQFHFSDAPIKPLQQVFAQKFSALLRKYPTRVVLLHLPRAEERDSTTINESALWLNLLPPGTPVVGIPPATLLRGLSDDDVANLYFDDQHFNKNGQIFFTRVIAPFLAKLYAEGNH